MFPNDKSIETLQQLFIEVKKYLALQKRYTQLEIAEKTNNSAIHFNFGADYHYS